MARAEPTLIACDTNLLIYAHRAGAPEHAAAVAALQRAQRARRGWGFPLPVVAEFWRVVTHPSISGGATSPRLATEFLQALWRAGAVCWLPLPGFEERLLAAGIQLEVAGRRVHDLQIALIAHEAGARELWTNDRDFVTLPGLELVFALGE